MRYLKIILLTGLLLLAAGSAFCAEVTAGQARAAVQAWLREDAAPLHAHMGQTFSSMETYKDSQNVPLYYVVYLKPSGFAIVSADDLIEPIIAFVVEGSYDPSSDNPLGALVSRDLPNRMQRVKKHKGVPTGVLKRARSKWTRLQEPKAAASTAAGSETAATSNATTISDVRVDPLVQSRWSQTTVGWIACYNYYTPPNTAGSSANYPCGCVATAMAQLMRYYKYPTAGVGTNSFTIQIDGTNALYKLRGGDGIGGAYLWSDMTLDPKNSGVNTTQRQAIGALTYDAGVAVKMMYAGGASSAYVSDAGIALTNTFKYSNKVRGYNNNNNIGNGLYGMVNPNLDAGYPILFGISGTPGGHAIVCDGYGYNSDTMYHHLNLGWGGVNDAWYNLPTIDTDLGTFSVIYECLYNIYVSGSGEIISGRITDSAGTPLTNATVTAVRSGGTYTTNTNVRGIYAFPKILANSTYTLSVSNSDYVFTNQTVHIGTKSTDGTAASANKWGVDFTAAPLVTLSLSGSPMAEAGGIATVTATLSATYTLPVTVNLAFFGTATRTNDYATASSITIPAGSKTNSITLTAVQDTLDESNETIVVDIASVGNATADGTQQVVAIIEDDDPYPDIDDDGLPDSWEQQYFGGTTNANPTATASNGVNTILEAYVAGLNPTNPQSFFTTTADAVSNGFVVNWDSITGRVYGVYQTTNLLSGGSFQSLETNIVWPQSSYTDTMHNAESHSFYKINVRLAP